MDEACIPYRGPIGSSTWRSSMIRSNNAADVVTDAPDQEMQITEPVFDPYDGDFEYSKMFQPAEPDPSEPSVFSEQSTLKDTTVTTTPERIESVDLKPLEPSKAKPVVGPMPSWQFRSIEPALSNRLPLNQMPLPPLYTGDSLPKDMDEYKIWYLRKWHRLKGNPAREPAVLQLLRFVDETEAVLEKLDPQPNRAPNIPSAFRVLEGAGLMTISVCEGRVLPVLTREGRIMRRMNQERS